VAAFDQTVQCAYELVNDGKVVSTGHLTLPRLPAVGDVLKLGGAALKVDAVLPGPRLRLLG
jgi:hypothetical protein